MSFRDLESDMALEKVLATKGQQQQELIGNLLEDEKYQREAFRSLFVKEDARHAELCTQVEQIQSQLASLTMVEMTKKDLKVEFEKDVMREKRETLTTMLMSLMDQKEARQAELSARLNELEKHKSQETDNYWLIQYQKLLDAKPKGLLEAEKAIDPDLKEVLVKAGAEEYVPILAMKDVNKKQVAYMNDKQLSEVILTGKKNAKMNLECIAISSCSWAFTTDIYVKGFSRCCKRRPQLWRLSIRPLRLL